MGGLEGVLDGSWRGLGGGLEGVLEGSWRVLEGDLGDVLEGVLEGNLEVFK